ncbi:MAG: protein kinase [Hormoscilla sp.]
MLETTLRNRYYISKKLGNGGTYLAEDRELPGGNVQCVVKNLKLVNPEPATLSAARDFFDKEAQILYKLGNNSEEIPRLFAHFEENEEFYLVREFVDGHSLRQELTEGKPLSENEVEKLLQEILEALVFVHENNVIHGNINPKNLIRRQKDSKIVLINFHKIKEITNLTFNNPGQGMTIVMNIVRGYMPVEQGMGMSKLCSDVYAVGMIGIQALTGVRPDGLQKNDNTGGVIWRERAKVSNGLADILDKMVSYDFSQRYQDAAEALEAWQSQSTITIPKGKGQSVNVMLGKTLQNRYDIIKPLGSGGFGDTYLAKDRDFPEDDQCVVKRLKLTESDAEVVSVAKRLFRKEADVLYKLGNHDQIPRFFDYFEENGEFYIVQEFVDGHDLSQEIAPGKQLSEKEVVKLLQEILEVLVFVHENDVIHRDIKPKNLLRRQRDDKIVMIDFGAVKEITTLSVNAQGQARTIAIGTGGYMPAEQALGMPKLCSDVYAVGMIGIQALTGVNPRNLRKDDNTGEVIWRDRAKVSNKLAGVLDKMVRDHFIGRYQDAAEALQVLKQRYPQSSQSLLGQALTLPKIALMAMRNRF